MDAVKIAQCYLVMPMGEEFREIQESITESLLHNGIEVLNVETVTVDSLASTVRQLIAQADFIIADISGNNPNVMYELGFAHGLKKPVLLLTQNDSGRIPSNLAIYSIIVYDKANLQTLGRLIERGASRLLARGDSEE